MKHTPNSPETQIEKRCTKCGLPKLLSEFCKHGFSKDGHEHICRACRKKGEGRTKAYSAYIKKKTGLVYLAECNGFYKIGMTTKTDVSVYLSKSLTWIPPGMPVTPILAIPSVDIAGLERKLHEEFKNKRVRGEWFDLTEKDIVALQQFADKVKTETDNCPQTTPLVEEPVLGTETTVARKTFDVSQCNGPMLSVRSTLKSLHSEGHSISAIAKHFGLNKAIISRILNSPAAWSSQAIEAVTGKRWESLRIHCQLADDLPREGCPSVLETTIELRRCPVTDTVFLPKYPTQRYRPGLSPAVRRAARRNLAAACTKYNERGDWGIK